MGPLAKGTVVLVPFPFSDLSRSKMRPAVVLAPADRDDYILCQITSNPYADPGAIKLGGADFQQGSLARESHVRPAKLFTAHRELFISTVGLLNVESTTKITDAVIGILKR